MLKMYGRSFLLVTLLHVVFLSTYSLAVHQCPPKEDVHPCVCKESGDALIVHCTGLKGITEIQECVKNLQEKSVSQMTISKSNLSYIPADAFEGVKISFLDIIDSEITIVGRLGDPQFKGQDVSLEILTITNSFKETAPLAYLFLGHLKKLHALNLSKNYVGLVHNKWFTSGHTSLRSLSFQEAKIRVIGPQAFADLVNLVSLDMCRNEITYISPYMFPNPAKHLTDLDFSFNKLSSLPEDLFLGMPKLSSVNFELNEFTTISEETWLPVSKQIKYLNMEYNPLECDSKLKWIYEKGNDFVSKIVATCYKPFHLMDRTLDSLSLEELS